MSRNSNFSRQHQADEDFTRAAWDLAEDAERTWGPRFYIQLYPMAQRGVWYVAVEVRAKGSGASEGVVARHSGSYPNGRAATLGAYLFALCNSAYQMTEARVGAYGSDEGKRA